MAIDPYRTLGLTTAASLDEVKRAYRRLAKQYHPDAAGDDATRRFLAVQAAYEAIVGGTNGSRGRGGATRPGGAPPWQADPCRARATREAYRARGGAWATGGTQAGTAGGSQPASGQGGKRPGVGQDPRARRPGSAGDDAEGAAGAGSASGTAGPAGRAGRRSPTRRKATLTSTSYDEAPRDPFEPDWEGGSWYGTSSGTYWTINPKEYADPRKHGPEYQARARRAAARPGEEPDHSSGPWTAPTATWAGTAEDPIGATSPDRDPASQGPTRPPRPRAASDDGMKRTGSSSGQAGDRPPVTASRRTAGGGLGRVPAAAQDPLSPIAAGLRAAALAAIPSSVLLMAALAGGSALAALALIAPPAVGLAVAALAARRAS